MPAAGDRAGREARAVEAVHAQPVFRTSVVARAETQSGRLADRWAPEGQGAARGPAMRTLGFADRLIGSYLGEGLGVSRRAGAIDRPVAPMNWLFPVPWYLDELDWLSAGRAAAVASRRAAVRSGEVARPVVSPAAPERRAEPVSETRFDLPLELVAPGLAAARSMEQARGTSPARTTAPAMRAYSPMVDPAAARAAEFLAELYDRSAAGARLAQAAEAAAAFRPAPIFEYVAPAELIARGAGEQSSRGQIARAARETLEVARQAEAIAEERARMAAVQAAAQAQARPVARPADVPAAAGEAARLEALRAEEAAARAEAVRVEEAARAEGVRAEAAQAETVRGEIARAEVARAEATPSEAARTDAMRTESARAEAARALSMQEAEAMRVEAARRAPSPNRRAIELLAASALSGDRERMVLAAGPRVLLPAGLGGVVAAAHQSRAVHEPVAAPAAFRRARAALTAEGSSTLAASRPAALEHLVWSDRWLARFAGASGGALRSFDMARSAPTIRTGVAADWQPAWVSTPPSDRGGAARSISQQLVRSAPGRVFTAPIVDDNEPVGDDVLHAIAAAASSDRRDRQRPAARRPAGPAEPIGPFRAPAADRALARFAMPSSPGLRPALGSSPVAALLASLLDGSTHTPFDARPLFAASVSDFLARGAARAASSTAQRAPGATWLALPALRASEGGRAPLRALPGGASTELRAAATGGRPAPLLSLVAPDAIQAAGPAAEARRAAVAAPGRLSAPPIAAMTAGAHALSARPGSLAVGAEGFASARAAAAADLSLDFLVPEVLAAARAFGFTPSEAVRAQRLAASGRSEMSRLASVVDQVFVAALSPSAGAAAPGLGAAAGAAAPGLRAAAASSVSGSERIAAGELASITARRAPRGAFLMPSATSRAFGITAGQAESTQPGIAAALELVAAGQVAEVAAQRTGSAALPALAETGGARASLAGLSPATDDATVTGAADPARTRGHEMREAAQERVATEAARAMLPRYLWSVFDAVYLSLGDETVASDVRPLGPAARAARALALAGRARGPEDIPLSARVRAAAAWAVLPVVMTGGGAAASARLPVASGAAPARASRLAATSRGHVAGSGEAESARGTDDAPTARPAASRAGEALASLVAPSFFRADDRGDGYGHFSPERGRVAAAPSTTFVETGVRERPAPPPPRPAPPPPPPRPAPRAEPTQKEFEAWFQTAAKKYFGEAPSQSGLTVAEMTLVSAAPRAQIAAASIEAVRPVMQTQMAAPGAAAGPGASPDGGGGQPNIDKIAQDVYEEIVRMLAIARERSGDPWNR